MIRINLSGAPRTKKGKRSAAAMPAGEGGTAGVLLGVIIIVVFLAGNLFYYHQLSTQGDTLQQELVKQQQEGVRLKNVKLKFDELQAKTDSVKKRVDVIDQLRAAQSGPLDLLNHVSDSVNATDAVWLDSMQDQGSNITLKGDALSVQSIANLMTNLQKVGQFKSVEMKEAYQDASQKNMQVFLFTLICEKQSQQQKS